MSELLIPPLAMDDRSRAIDALAARLSELDLTPVLVYLIDLVPADALPILAEQFNVVGPLWAYLPDDAAKRRAIKDSVAWHRAKGTPWSVETAISWAGILAKVEDTTGSVNRWAEYQLEMGAPVDGAALQAVLELARFAAPARSHLVRLYHGFDRRVLHASSGDHWSDGYLSDDSGVWVDGVKLSFRRTSRLAAQRQDVPISGRIYRLHASHTNCPDVLRWSDAHFGDKPVLNHPVIHGRLVGMSNSLPLRNPISLTGHRRLARAAFAVSDDYKVGDPNTRFGGYATTISNPFRFSDPDCRVSDFDHGIVRTPIDEVWIATHSMAATTPSDFGHMGDRVTGQARTHSIIQPDAIQPLAAVSTERIHSSISKDAIGTRASRYGWSGGWDRRRWSGDISFTHQTLTD